MKIFFKNLIIFLLFISFVGGALFLGYYYSPEVKVGEIGILYKNGGNEPNFTPKVLQPGKYYCFITVFNPLIHKIYTLKLSTKNFHLNYKAEQGINLDISLLYSIDQDKILNFIKRADATEDSKIIEIYLSTSLREYFSNLKINDFFANDFIHKFNSYIPDKINKDISYFGLKISKIDITKFDISEDAKKIYEAIKQNDKDIAMLALESEKKLNETKLTNKVKEEELKFLLYKAESEKAIVMQQIESQKLLREESRKRMEQDVEILSKQGGALAAKLEAIRILANSPSKAEGILKKMDDVFNR